MAATSIEWATDVWNPTAGCDRVSPGCDHCYAMTMAKRLKGMGQPKYQLDGDPRTSGPGFLAHEWPDALGWPLTVKKPMRVFVNSMSDLFHDRISDEFIARVFAVMAAAPQHMFQILTKRHARMRSLLSSQAFDLAVADAWSALGVTAGSLDGGSHTPPWPLPNVWLGVSVENQQWANIRIPALLDTPAAVRFLSCEPLLGPVRLPTPSGIAGVCYDIDGQKWHRSCPACAYIDWVIVGGESGHGARPMHPGWARSLRAQCVSAGVPFLFKQWGEWGPAGTWRGPDHHMAPDGRLYAPGEHVPDEVGAVAAIHRWGKKAAGRELDGRTWDEYPQAVTA